MLLVFFFNVTRARVTLEKGTSVEKNVSSREVCTQVYGYIILISI